LIPSLALLGTGCGSDFNFGSGKRAASPIAAVYDLEALYPGLEFPDLNATGLELDLEVEFEPPLPGAPPGEITGEARILEARVGGVVRTFDPNSPMPVAGTLRGETLDLFPFGPVTIGMLALYVELHGTLSPEGRTITGLARLSNMVDEGAWEGIRQRSYLVAASDFGINGTATIITVRFGGTPDVSFEVRRDAELISGDPVAASSGDLPFIVNRLSNDNVQVLDRDRDFLTALQFSTGNGSNPHDALLAAPGRLYVTRYEPAFDDVLVADPNTGDVLGRIPLAAWATNASATARPDRIVQAGGHVLVTMQNIDSSFRDYGPGLAAFIDPADDSVISVLTLAGQNPFGPPSVHPATGEVYLADAGIFPGLLPRSLSGGIEVIDPVTMTSLGLLVDDDDAGGNISGVAVAGEDIGYMVVVTDTGSNSLVAFHPATGAIGNVLLSTSAFIPEIRYDGDGYLLVAEHDTNNPGLRVLDAATGTGVVRIPLSLPPVSVAILTRDLLEFR